MTRARPLPMITADLPGVGGVLKTRPDDFEVVEIPAYGPAGRGDHVLATIEKRDLSTPAAVSALARALGVRPGDVGTAGLKDRRALTRQQITLPPPVRPEDALAARVPGVSVTEAARHPHKLKTGHLRGNIFRVRVRELAVEAPEAASRARAILATLAEPPGCPNWYGEQRFGAADDNATRGREIVTGERSARDHPPRRRRLLISAFQSHLFNEYLRRRVLDERYRAVISGDLLQPARSRGIFASEDPAAESARLGRGEIVQTGPMFGPRMRRPAPDTEAAGRERDVLAAEGIGEDAFAPVAKLAPGTRRPIAIAIHDAAAESERDDAGEALRVTFSLPPGAYATIVLREITKAEEA